MSKAILYDYFRSSAAYRVRIALNLKGIAYDRVPVNLLDGDQKKEAYRDKNPQGLVPLLEIDGLRISQSLAIIDYLESVKPEPRLLPSNAGDRAHVLSLALTVACDIHPLNNLRVLKYLVGPLGQDEDAKNGWIAHWIEEGLCALEAMAAPGSGRFLFGDDPSLADICLVPQLFNARRFNVPLDQYPTLVAVDAEAAKIGAFAAAHPDRVEQP